MTDFNVATATPAEIDARIEVIRPAIAKHSAVVITCTDKLDPEAIPQHRIDSRYTRRARNGRPAVVTLPEIKYYESREDLEEKLDTATRSVAFLEALVAPLEARYDVERWNRYYHCTATNGHVHRDTGCSTCSYKTEYFWRTDLSGKTDTDMVNETGTAACSVCFPDAPTLSAWGAAVKREAAEQAAKDATFCQHDKRDHTPHNRKYTSCNGCGGCVYILASGAMRKHKPGCK